jgi:hypothetical protein
MGQQIIKQPDGRLAVFSSESDTFILMDATPAEIIQWRAEQAAEAERKRTRRELGHVLSDNPRAAYFQFARTWQQAVQTNQEHGGDLTYTAPPEVMTSPPTPPEPEPPRFQWKLMDGHEQRWSKEHTLEGTCPGCCCNGPKTCPDCGGREHGEPVEGMTADGWESVHAEICQQEREDGIGDPAETRDIPPSGQKRQP